MFTAYRRGFPLPIVGTTITAIVKPRRWRWHTIINERNYQCLADLDQSKLHAATAACRKAPAPPRLVLALQRKPSCYRGTTEKGTSTQSPSASGASYRTSSWH